MSDWRERLLARRRIAIDMDHVMADTGGALVSWLDDEYGLQFDTPQSFGTLRRSLSGREREALIARVSDGGMFRDLPLMENCAEVVRDLNERFAVLICTAAMEYPNGIPAKIAWLNEHFPYLEHEQFVFCGPKQIMAVDWLVDDSQKHFDSFGGHPVLYSAPHNREVAVYDRVDDWTDVATYFDNADR